MGLSAVVITFNEEKNIERCLGALGFCDEIVVLDSFSTDRTVEIAGRFTDRVFQRTFAGFSTQKQAAVDLAREDWVLVIDADEVVTHELAEEIRNVLEVPAYGAYSIPRRSYFLGRAMLHCGWYPDNQLRLVERRRAHFPERIVHETIVVDCPTGHLKNDMLHYTYPTMDEYLRKMISYARAGAEQRYIEGKRFRFTDLIFRPGLTFFKRYVLQRGFMDGAHGLMLSVLDTVSVCVRYAILWSMELSIRAKG